MMGKAIFFLLTTVAMAQAATPTATVPQAPPCGSALHHQLDFWVGDWSVYQSIDEKKQVATSRIETVMDGCGIRENFASPIAPSGGAYSGTSYSGYDRKDGKWHQMYVDTNGNVTWYTGGLDGVDMVLTAPGKDGTLQKMTYHPGSDGSVRQTGLVSADDGKTWQPGYDLIYRKK
jgi:hypothetical protein